MDDQQIDRKLFAELDGALSLRSNYCDGKIKGDSAARLDHQLLSLGLN